MRTWTPRVPPSRPRLVLLAVAGVLAPAAAVEDGRILVGGLLLGALALVWWRRAGRAGTDRLTGLADGGVFRATSVSALTQGARTGKHTAILAIGVHGLAEVNDTLGHDDGDLLLVRLAEVLRVCVPRTGVICRVGGDEFAVVLPEVDRPEEAYEVAGRIAAALGPVAVNGHLVTLAAGIGVAVSTPGERSIGEPGPGRPGHDGLGHDKLSHGGLDHGGLDHGGLGHGGLGHGGISHDELAHRAGQAMQRARSLGPDTRWAIWQEPPATGAAAPLAAA